MKLSTLIKLLYTGILEHNDDIKQGDIIHVTVKEYATDEVLIQADLHYLYCRVVNNANYVFADEEINKVNHTLHLDDMYALSVNLFDDSNPKVWKQDRVITVAKSA